MIVIKIFISFSLYVLTCAQVIEYYPSKFNDVNTERIENNIMINKKSNVKVYKNVDTNNYHLRTFNNYDFNRSTANRNESFLEKRSIDPAFRGHPKTREDLWNEHFLKEDTAFDQTPSLIKLLHNITLTYLKDCTPVILYDVHVEAKEAHLLQNLFKNFPVTYTHGRINDNNQVDGAQLLTPNQECLHIIIFLADVQRCDKVIGLQATSKVVVVARSSQWAVQEFLSGPSSRKFVNLLLIGQSFKDEDDSLEAPYILYTHKLYTDGLGASKPIVLTSWRHGKYTRNINLFPLKMTKGYAGHRFIVAAANQPPFVFKRIISDSDGGNPRVVWDGIEMRILKMLAKRNNFSIEIHEPKDLHILGPGDAVSKEIILGRADIGVAGLYVTSERKRQMDVSISHSQDCAVFITLMSTALPRYRAILGPFHWHVWLALSFTYLIGIFPLAFSDKHTLRHLIHNGGEIENMFWYVFGTFTNCFTFVGKNSWSKTNKVTTRLLIGWYWIFTIIITSCYTGSIIAFVTLPVYPSTVDTINQLLSGFYRVGTLDRGGWERWFVNSSDPQTYKLLKKIEFVPDIVSGLRNTTKAFFWPYAFLGSQAQLEYVVQSNFSITKSKRAVLHISNECFVPFGVSLAFPNESLYTAKINRDIGRMIQSGILNKIMEEVRWEMQRTGKGKLLSVAKGSLRTISIEEKGLTLEDTQGMFLLLGAGFLIAAAALMSEWMGGCSRRCRLLLTRNKDDASVIIGSNIDVSPRNLASSQVTILPDDVDSVSDRGENLSPCSQDTLDGQIIHLADDNVIVHSVNGNEWGKRRSSTPDVDREVQAIFEREEHRKRNHSICVTDISEWNEGGTA